jgi:hypothetical protein
MKILCGFQNEGRIQLSKGQDIANSVVGCAGYNGFRLDEFQRSKWIHDHVTGASVTSKKAEMLVTLSLLEELRIFESFKSRFAPATVHVDSTELGRDILKHCKGRCGPLQCKPS